MKKSLLKFLVVSTLIALFVPALGQTKTDGVELSKKEIKQIEKIAKQQTKKLTKEGWKIDASTMPLEYQLKEHYIKLADKNNREMVGSVSSCSSRNVCQQWALNNAITKYAQEAKSHVMGRVVTELGSIANTELDSFYAAYERLVSATIQGELQTCFSLIKENEDGNHEYDTYFIINESQASKKRVAAMENALKESKAAQKYAEQISAFVREDISNN